MGNHFNVGRHQCLQLHWQQLHKTAVYWSPWPNVSLALFQCGEVDTGTARFYPEASYQKPIIQDIINWVLLNVIKNRRKGKPWPRSLIFVERRTIKCKDPTPEGKLDLIILPRGILHHLSCPVDGLDSIAGDNAKTKKGTKHLHTRDCNPSPCTGQKNYCRPGLHAITWKGRQYLLHNLFLYKIILNKLFLLL